MTMTQSEKKMVNMRDHQQFLVDPNSAHNAFKMRESVPNIATHKMQYDQFARNPD